MNLGGVGSPSPGLNCTRFFDSTFQLSETRVTASKRLLQSNISHDSFNIPVILSEEKDRLIPSRKKEELIALRNLRRRIADDTKFLKSFNQDALYNYYLNANRFVNSKNIPHFLNKIISIRVRNPLSDEDYVGDVFEDDFISEALLWHNIYRKQHRAPPLKISPQLCGKAQSWANHLAHMNTFQYSTDKSIGQNIFCRLNDFQADISGQEVVSNWYSGYKKYSFDKNSDMLHVNVNGGSFTQLVWKNTKFFGIGRARSRSGKILVVSNYQPAGNICGLFHQNVSPPIGNKKSVRWK